MTKQNLIISKLEGYSGIRLHNEEPLVIKNGINLLVGRNGSGKTNLLRLIQSISVEEPDVNFYVESGYFIDRSRIALKKSGSNISNRFGRIEVVNYSFGGKSGSISISLKNVPEDFVLENIIEPGAGIQGQITTTKKGPTFKLKSIYGNSSVLTLDFGGSININVLSKNRSKDLSSIIEGPIDTINSFVYDRILSFFNSQEFDDKIKELQDLLNEKLKAFFGSTDKSIQLFKSSRHGMSIKPILLDGNNEIKPENISTGENALLNLIFSLSTAIDDQSDVLSFDEPEIHMHDDMISVFVNEIIQISNAFPKCKILVATHSTSLIEKFAFFGTQKTNLIVFNEKREVFNSDNDIDLINALNRNGVWFSPLMLSKRHNLYIENQGTGESSHRDFYARFFDFNYRPNIIPIGSGASVEQSQSFSETLQELMNSSDIRSKGIRDGDLWLKDSLIKYVSGKIKLDELVVKLIESEDFYIKVDGKKNSTRPDYYFNFWEIENLYLMDELRGCWKQNNKTLTQDGFSKFLKKSKQTYANEYLESYYKSLSIRHNKKHSLKKKLEVINDRLNEAKRIAEKEGELNERAISLVEKLIELNLTKWLPGKEMKKALEEDYTFDSSEFDFNSSPISLRVREILEL